MSVHLSQNLWIWECHMGNQIVLIHLKMVLKLRFLGFMPLKYRQLVKCKRGKLRKMTEVGENIVTPTTWLVLIFQWLFQFFPIYWYIIFLGVGGILNILCPEFLHLYSIVNLFSELLYPLFLMTALVFHWMNVIASLELDI